MGANSFAINLSADTFVLILLTDREKIAPTDDFAQPQTFFFLGFKYFIRP